MGLCCCKKITDKNKTKEVIGGKITFDTVPDFKVPIIIVKLNGFLKSSCRIWQKFMPDGESPEYLKKFPSKDSFQSFDCIDTVF